MVGAHSASLGLHSASLGVHSVSLAVHSASTLPLSSGLVADDDFRLSSKFRTGFASIETESVRASCAVVTVEGKEEEEEEEEEKAKCEIFPLTMAEDGATTAPGMPEATDSEKLSKESWFKVVVVVITIVADLRCCCC